MRTFTFHVCRCAMLSLGALTAAGTISLASGPPYGIPSGVLPQDYYKYYKGYKEPPRRSTPPATVSQSPKKYTIQIVQVPAKHDADDPNIAIVMAHVPEDASIWVNERATRQRGEVRYFKSPSLKPDETRHIAVRVVWSEDGEWVTQTVEVPVRAGQVRCVYIAAADEAKEIAKVTKNIEKLSLADQKRAVRQRMCAVQDDKQLGSMGVPIKVTLKGKSVFLCCKGCVKEARSNPEQTLERAKKLRSTETPAGTGSRTTGGS